jgi:ArsR family transcriptional regulator
MGKLTSRRRASRRELPDQALQLIASRFKALSEASRLKLIIALEEGERSVGCLVEATGLTQANVSRQLSLLARAGIVARRKEGVTVFYSISDPAILDLCDHVCGSLQRELARQAESARLFPAR